MRVSVFDIFKIGIGPSSSHTMGPMKAAKRFVDTLAGKGLLQPGKIATVNAELFGSLALTGKGHCTDSAVILGLMGHQADLIDTQKVPSILAELDQKKQLSLGGKLPVAFTKQNILWKKTSRLEFHTNGMRFNALDEANNVLFSDIFYSIGGGFILSEAEVKNPTRASNDEKFPLHFETARELLAICKKEKLDIPSVMMINEKSLKSESEIITGLDRIAEAMETCINNGLNNQGILPGGLGVRRRAADLFSSLKGHEKHPFYYNNWLAAMALAVNEENASGGRVVTAPTNGAAGIVPAVLAYYRQFFATKHSSRIHDFLLTAAAIGILFKKNATFSGAEGGCQAEVGVACSMAAGGLTQVLHGTPSQVENAAEIGIEHNLGLTCDPAEGLVQIPCIERNAMAAVKATTASSLALASDGQHIFFLDSAIKTMKEIGQDMKRKYKETSLGGIAKTLGEDIRPKKEKTVGDKEKLIGDKEKHKEKQLDESRVAVSMPEC